MNVDKMISMGLKKGIEQSDKSQAQIARELGVSRPTVSQYVSGRIQPTLETFTKLCLVLDRSADELLGLEHRGAHKRG